MTNIKYHQDIQTKSDLYNLITSVILRQEKPFSMENIYEQVVEKLTLSAFDVEKYPEKIKIIQERIYDTIEKLYSIDCLDKVKIDHTKLFKLHMSFPSVVNFGNK